MSDRCNNSSLLLDNVTIWKGFLAASDDADLGFKQVPKSLQFQKTMMDYYRMRMKVQDAFNEQKTIEHISTNTINTNTTRRRPETTNQQLIIDLEEEEEEDKELVISKAIIDRYNNVVGPEVFRFMIVMKTIQQTTTFNNNNNEALFYKECHDQFETKYKRKFLYTIETSRDRALVLCWLDQLKLDSSDVVLLQLSEAAFEIIIGVDSIIRFSQSSIQNIWNEQAVVQQKKSAAIINHQTTTLPLFPWLEQMKKDSDSVLLELSKTAEEIDNRVGYSRSMKLVWNDMVFYSENVASKLDESIQAVRIGFAMNTNTN